MTRSSAVLLTVILVVGAAARLVGLGHAPPGLHPDEAVNASEARSIAETLATSDGRRLPLTVSMHGGVSWTEASYVWVAAPFSALPVSPEVAIRLPAALAGLLLIPCVYVLALLLSGSRSGALLAAGFVAVEPFAVHYSRLGLRASLIPPLLTIGLALAVSSTRGPKTKRSLLSAAGAGVVLSLTLLTYTPARMVVPLMLGALVMLSSARDARTALLLLPPALAVVATLPWAFSEQGGARLGSISVAANADGPVHALWLFAKGYVLHYSPRMLAWGSSSKGFWAEGVAPLLAVEVALIPLGLAALLRRARRGAFRARLLLSWFALFPLASAMTVPAPNPMRAIFAVPLLALIATEGADGLRVILRRARRQRWAARATWAGLLVSALLAGQSYFVRFPARERNFWYAQHPTAIRAAVDAARAANADLVFHCGWLEASLVTLHADDAPSQTRFSSGRASVRLRLGGQVAWTATTRDNVLTLRDAAGLERGRHPLH